MLEARKCARCGSMYISETEVCGRCQKKDGADLYKLKGFLEKGYGEVTQGELSVATGISNKNLSRFLRYDEFKGVCVEEKAIPATGEIGGIGEEINGINGGIELV